MGQRKPAEAADQLDQAVSETIAAYAGDPNAAVKALLIAKPGSGRRIGAGRSGGQRRLHARLVQAEEVSVSSAIWRASVNDISIR